MKHHETYSLLQSKIRSIASSPHLLSSRGSVPSQRHVPLSFMFPESLTSITCSVLSSLTSNRFPLDLMQLSLHHIESHRC